MKHSVILTLAALLLCGCAKDDNEAYVFHNDFFYYHGEKIPIRPIEDRYYVIIKAADSARILSEFELNGIVMDMDSYRVIGLNNHPRFDVPDELMDCHELVVTSSKDPAEVVSGIINSNHLYLVEHYTYEYNKSFILGVGIAKENATEALASLKRYASQLGVYILKCTDSYGDLALNLACTNRSAGDNVQVANWLYETGEFMFASPEMGGYFPPP